MLKLQKSRLLSDFSTFQIGGPARYFIQVKTVEELQEALQYAHKQSLPVFILGKGSNSLFSDRGFDGLVIHNKIAFCEIDKEEVSVGAGYSFSLLGVQTARKGLSGLEFASGIPASVGGALFMNAGANGAEICSVVKEVTFIDLLGEKTLLSRDQIQFSYRWSSFHEKPGAIAAVTFVLTPNEMARKQQLEIIEYRTKTQPYGERSCGCVFRNPEGNTAGALIEQCGLKGKRVGGALVSEIHANFIINANGASALDVLKLAQLIKECVKQKTGIELEMELRKISDTYEFISR